jgi:hypothetical protein
MLTRVDRVQVVVGGARDVAGACRRLLDAEVVREDRLSVLGTRRSVLRAGTSEIELLEPDGVGAAADFLAATKGGLFAGGFATPDLDRLRRELEHRGIVVAEEGGQLFVSPEALGVPGLRTVISAERDLAPVGLLGHLYEVTDLVHDVESAVHRTAGAFGLDRFHFVPIHSAEFGYEGILTLFHPDRLDRIEMIRPFDVAKTMGRFCARRGPSLYMCYFEADDLAPIRSRLAEHAPNDWSQAPEPDNLFIHPKALGGLMIGVSRTTMGWRWSGHPERVVRTANP